MKIIWKSCLTLKFWNNVEFSTRAEKIQEKVEDFKFLGKDHRSRGNICLLKFFVEILHLSLEPEKYFNLDVYTL